MTRDSYPRIRCPVVASVSWFRVLPPSHNHAPSLKPSLMSSGSPAHVSRSGRGTLSATNEPTTGAFSLNCRGYSVVAYKRDPTDSIPPAAVDGACSSAPVEHSRTRRRCPYNTLSLPQNPPDAYTEQRSPRILVFCTTGLYRAPPQLGKHSVRPDRSHAERDAGYARCHGRRCDA